MPDHLIGHRPHAVERSPHGHIDGSPKAGHVRQVERDFVAVKRVGDKDVQAAEVFHRLGHYLFDRILLRYIYAKKKRPPIRGANLIGKLLGPFRIGEVVDRDIGTGLSEGKRRRPTNAGGSAGHKSNLALECCHGDFSGVPFLPYDLN